MLLNDAADALEVGQTDTLAPLAQEVAAMVLRTVAQTGKAPEWRRGIAAIHRDEWMRVTEVIAEGRANTIAGACRLLCDGEIVAANDMSRRVRAFFGTRRPVPADELRRWMDAIRGDPATADALDNAREHDRESPSHPRPANDPK
ncbi:MAG: hypothetical protein ACOY5V_01120 [Pseudomonadota bacterium]